MSIARLLMFAVLAAASPACAVAQTDVEAMRMRPIPIGPQPRTCPERGAFGFCFYDSGWRPRADNPYFQPLRRGDPRADSGPMCTITNRRGATLADYGEEEGGPAMRIAGRLVRFRPIADDRPGRQRFRSPRGMLTIEEGATVARGDENEGHRAQITFVDRRGRAHSASVRIDCGL